MDPVSHAILPLLAILAVGVEPKKALTLLPFAVFPDLDTVFGLWAHRVVFHNFIFVVLIPFLVFIYVYRYHSNKLKLVYISWFYLISHLILDLQGGFAFFWPISRKAPYISFEITTRMAGEGPRIFFDLDYGFASGAPEFTGGSLLTPATFLILMLVGLSMFVNRKKVFPFIRDFKNFLVERLYSLFH